MEGVETRCADGVLALKGEDVGGPGFEGGDMGRIESAEG